MKQEKVFPEIKKSLTEYFEKSRDLFTSTNSSELLRLRNDAFEKFKDIDFPNQKNEEWKYVNLSPVLNKSYLPSFLLPLPQVTKNIIEKYSVDAKEHNLLVFINGVFYSEFSIVKEKEKFHIISNIRNELSENSAILFEYINRSVNPVTAFTELNNAFIYDGAAVIIKPGKIVENPVELLFINSSSQENQLINIKNIFVVGENARAEIIESYAGTGTGKYLTNVISDFHLMNNSVLHRTKLISETPDAFHIAVSNFSQEANSVLHDYSISAEGAVIRNDLITSLNGKGIESNIYGLYIGNSEQLIDNHTLIDHRQPNCNSNQLYKGVVGDNARAVFNGKVFVRKDSQKTNAYQSNKNLLLSEQATVNTKPQLEIFADDVKCSHGATVGQLDDDALFYLQTRGISKSEAYKLLVSAFANDVTENIENESIRNKVEEIVSQKLKGFALNKEQINAPR